MRKVLLGCTALVAVAVVAAPPAAQAANEKIKLGLGGYMEQWFGYTDQDNVGGKTDANGVGQESDTEIWFTGSTTLDNGITFGVNVQLEGNTSGDTIDESYLFIKGDFGEVLMGDENSAAYKMQYSAPDVGIGANSGDQTVWVSFAGVGGTAGSFRGAFGTTFVEAARVNDIFKLTYFSPRFSGFQFGVSYAPANQQDGGGVYDRDVVLHDFVGVGANFVQSFNGVDVAVAGGYSQITGGAGAPDPESYSFGVNVGVSGFTVGGSYAHSEDDPAVGDMDGWDVGASYGTGPWEVSAIYFHGERDGLVGGAALAADNDTIMGSVRYTLGPGIRVVGTIGYTEIEAQTAAGTDNEAVYVVVGPKLSF